MKSYANIAIVKYWGKESINPVIPSTPSISLRLDKFFTETKIEKSNENVLFINDIKASDMELNRALNLVNKIVKLNFPIKINSYNSMPTSAGLSSSSSAMSALVLAVNEYFKLNLSINEMINYAKEGSGSSCRSFYKIAGWYDDKVEEITTNLNLSMMVMLVSSDKKEISSTRGMEICKNTATNFNEWVEKGKKDYYKMKKALLDNNFSEVGKIMEENTLFMHSTTLKSTPKFTYFKEETNIGIDIVRKIREKGLECYFTIDAGPNIKVLYEKENEEKIYKELMKLWNKEIILCNN